MKNARGHLCGTVINKHVVDAAVGFNGDLFLEYKFAIQASSAATVKRLIEQTHGAPFRRAARRHHVSNRDGRQGSKFLDNIAAAFFRLLRFRGIGKFRGRPGRNIAEMFVSKGKSLRKIHISKNQQYRVIGNVISAEKRLDIGQACRVQIGEVTVKIMSVRPIAKRDRRHIKPWKAAVGLIHYVDAHLFFHNVPLVAEIFIIDLERAHTVGFEPQNAFQRI